MIELPGKDVINITVTKYDSIYVDYVEKAIINIDGQDISTKVRVVRTADKYSVASQILRARGKNIRALIVIKADRRASFGVMKDVMAAMQENHLERFLIITDQEIEALVVKGS
ncbi:MAG: biopolymer transporter ExbD, partial [Anaerolineae bacterium]|nr:biopolymer transporter ExbD [Anaerolineae bacterium]